MRALPVVGAVPCSAGSDEHVLRPIGKIAVNGDAARLAYLARGVGLVVRAECASRCADGECRGRDCCDQQSCDKQDTDQFFAFLMLITS